MDLAAGKHIYFLSDFHLGAPSGAASRTRELLLVQFLKRIEQKAAAVFVVGDMFDFWFEYRHVVPKGFVRILGQLGQMADRGIDLHFFVGNHDMWVKDYFQKELGMRVHMGPAVFEYNGKRFYIAHGDGLGPGDHGYKRLKKLFRNPVARFLFGILPPVVGMGLANYFSRKSREAVGDADNVYWGEDKEWLIIHSKALLQKEHFDYFIYGHRHLPMELELKGGAKYLNLGDWITRYTYADFDGSQLLLNTHDVESS